jgi:short-subunit dehydrogenase
MTNKTIVITGATGGIGTALTNAYSVNNNNLGLIAREHKKLKELSETCSNKQANITYSGIDVRDSKLIKTWINDFDSKNPIDILIANAGVTCGLGENNSQELEQEAKRVADVNYQGTVNTISSILDKMIERKQGHIVIIASLAGLSALADMPSYSASKAAIIAYGHSIRQWLKPYNIHVTIICPGFITSPMSARHIGKKPFEMSAENAAVKIVKAINKKKKLYAFPFLLAAGTQACRLLPIFLSDLFMKSYKADIKKDPRFKIL